MHVLILMQSINQHYVDTILEALPEGAQAVLLTGTRIITVSSPHEVVYTTPHMPKSFLSRIKSWILYAWNVGRWYQKNHKLFHADLIYAVSNPPINSFLGVWLKKKFKAKFVYMEWDIYPQIIEENFSSHAVKLFCKIWHKKNNKYMPQIDRLVTIADKMLESILVPLHEKPKTSVIHIYTDTGRMKPIKPAENPFRKENGLDGKFVVIYSGKMGYGHNIPLILDAAEIVAGVEKDIIFLLIGNGPGYEMAEERIAKGVKNIKLMPPQPESVFPLSMASGDIGIVSEEAKLAKLFMPSKSYDMMACGLPLVGMCSKDDDLFRLISMNEVGEAVVDSKAETVAQAILALYRNPQERERYAQNARNTAVCDYSRKSSLKMYRQLFKELFDNQESNG